MRVLVIERQAPEAVARQPDERTVVVRTDKPEDALSIVQRGQFDVIVLDAISLRSSGSGLLRSMLEAGNATPVLALIDNDRVRPLCLGGDDAVDGHIELW